jgi:sugar lactone lactonase YvrE
MDTGRTTSRRRVALRNILGYRRFGDRGSVDFSADIGNVAALGFAFQRRGVYIDTDARSMSTASRYAFNLTTTPEFTASILVDPGSEDLRFLPECPRMLRHHPGRLGWIAIQHAADVLHGSINILDIESLENRQFVLDGRPGFFCETEEPDVVLIGMERRLVLFNLATGATRATVGTIDCRDDVIINDGVAVAGGVLFGTKHLRFNEPVAAVYFFESASRRVHMVFDGQTCSNGKFLRDDVLIDVDSIPKTISRYVLGQAFERVLDRSLIVQSDALPALPDGLRPAPDGESVVVAFYDPSEDSVDGVAEQISISDGAVLCRWRIPRSPRVTCPEFVRTGEGPTKVIFTTAVEGMGAEARRRSPHAGMLFIAETPFDGAMPELPPLVSLKGYS